MDPDEVDRFGSVWIGAFSGVFGDADGIGWLGAKTWFSATTIKTKITNNNITKIL